LPLVSCCCGLLLLLTAIAGLLLPLTLSPARVLGVWVVDALLLCRPPSHASTTSDTITVLLRRTALLRRVVRVSGDEGLRETERVEAGGLWSRK